jgi:prepilin-type N-terminal cleavage/methylation domain-containing protein
MSPLARRLASRRTPRRDDAGMSLIELLVAMSIFSVVLAVAMTGIVSVTGNLRKVSNQTDAMDQAMRTITRLDKEIPYATAVSAPGQVSSNWYFEYETQLAGTDTCDQWRLVASTDVIQHRTWLNGNTPPTTWDTVSTNIVNDPTTQVPFVLRTTADDSSLTRQVLIVDLFAQKGTGSTGSAETKETFVARNSSGSSDASDCIVRP